MGGSHSSHFPTYTPQKPTITESYDSYEKKSVPVAPKGKGMQLGRKSKAGMFDRVRDGLGAEAEERAPLVQTPEPVTSPTRPSFSSDGKSVQVIISEQISAALSREGSLKSLEVKGDLQLKILDQAFSKVKLSISADITDANFRPHPNVDKALFLNQSTIQLKDQSRSFPQNQQIGVLRWRKTTGDAPLSFTIWVNAGSTAGRHTVTVEYELISSDPLKDVIVSIPFKNETPSVNSMDQLHDITAKSIDWTLPFVGEENSTGSFEFEAEGDEEADFFPMTVKFYKDRPVVRVNVSGNFYLLSRVIGVISPTERAFSIQGS